MQKCALIIWSFAFFSCSEQQVPGANKDFRDEMETRKLTRVTEGQLMDFAFKLGTRIFDTLDKDTSKVLLKSIQEKYNSSITYKYVDKLDTASKEYEIYEAYLYNVINNLPLEDNIQKIGESDILFTRPVINKKALKAIKSMIISKKELVKKYNTNEKIIL